MQQISRSSRKTALRFARRLLIVLTLSTIGLVLYFKLQGQSKPHLTAQASDDTYLAESGDSIQPKMPLIDLQWKQQAVKNGDNLTALFYRVGLSISDVNKISAAQHGASLTTLYPGEQMRFGMDSQGTLYELHYQKSLLESYIFVLGDNQYQSWRELRQPEVFTSYREGIIKESLFTAGKEAALPDKIVMELANIFGWDIDFVFDIRAGDSFALLFEERFIDGQRLPAGDILAASFSNRGKTYQAVRYTDRRGRSRYYTPEGLSMRKDFLRTPLDIFRISSGFNLRRKHPIHKKIKAHRGVDYAAPRGTPVYASGDGKVIEAGYTKPNGNYVVIQHGQTYTTKYLHLHRKKVRTGQSVRQRQLIGTVGATGYATGPHLHYEFLVNGIHRNPRTVVLPKAKPIPESERAIFLSTSTVLLSELAERQQAQQIASSHSNSSDAN
jgi:murein DD-endopeptidase MepM/ murein hydrolase activator NlpD